MSEKLADVLAAKLGDESVIQDELPTYDDCMLFAETLNQQTSIAEVKECITQIAKAKLDELEESFILKEIKNRTKMSVAILRSTLKTIKGKLLGITQEDLGLKVAQQTLKRSYNEGKHLIRSADKSFWRFDETHWARCNDEMVHSKILDCIKNMDTDEASYATLVNNTTTLIRAETIDANDRLALHSKPLPIINCSNGELHLDGEGNCTMQSHDYASYQTRCLDVAYKPDAACPNWDKAIDQIMCGDAEMVRHFHEFLGYVIQPQRPIESFWIMRGGGSNGKTAAMQVVTALMGKNAFSSMEISKLNERFALSGLVGKLMLLDDDVKTGTRLPDGILKQISEAKVQSVESKGKDFFDFMCVATPVMLCNNWPSTADLTHGLMRRAHVIPFLRMFNESEQDRGLVPRITANELPGVLNRALEGLKRVLKRGYFDDPEPCKRAKNEWMQSANPLSTFINECCRMGDKEGGVKHKDFYEAFVRWAAVSGVRNITNRKTVTNSLLGLGYEEAVLNGYKKWRGVYLKGESEWG
jgi:P4 family phage/plasmid primase-like protien